MRMEPCPKCGAPNSVKREGCFNCGTALVSPPPDAPSPAAEGAEDHSADSFWYLAAVISAAWVTSGPADLVRTYLLLPALGIGFGAGLFARRALEQAFPERNTHYLGIIAGGAVAWLAWTLVLSMR